MAVRLLLVDPHQIVREGIRALLEGQPGMEVVADCGNRAVAIELAVGLEPDVIIVDATLDTPAKADDDVSDDSPEDPEAIIANAQGIIRQLVTAAPQAHVIALSSRRGHRLLGALLGAGASAGLLKDCAAGELIEAVKHVTGRRGRYLGRDIVSQLFDDCCESMAHHPAQGLAPLTERERQVLRLLADGMSTKRVASTLELSRKTVEIHRRRLMRKLSIDSVAGLTRHALREGLAAVGDPIPACHQRASKTSEAGPSSNMA